MTDPSTLSGVVSWLRGKDLGSSGASISTWTAAGGNSGTAFNSAPTVATGATPSGGKAARFNHSGMSLGSLGLTTAGEMWIVLKASSTADAVAYAWKFGTDATGNQNNYYPYSGVVYDDFGVSARQNFTPSASVGSWRLYRVKASAGNWSAWLDGTLQLSTSATISFASTSYLSRSLGGGDGFVGDIAEVLVRNTVSTSGEVADLIAYFNSEHGLTVPGGTAPGSATGTLGGSTSGKHSASIAGNVVATGTLTAAVSAAKHAAAIAGLVTITGTLGGTVSGHSASLTGTASNVVSGTLSGAVTGKHSASIAGTIPANTGTLTATVTGHSAVFYETLVGTLTATTAGKHSARFYGEGPPTAEPWTLDDTGKAWTGTYTVPGTFDVDYPAAAVPAAVERVLLTRQSHQIPAGLITVDADGRPVPIDGADYPIVEEPVGHLHVWSGGVDVTHLHDVPVAVSSYSASLPFGETSAQVDFPQEMLLDTPHAHLAGDKPLDVAVVPEAGPRINLWSGRIVSRNGGTTGSGVTANRQCEGPLYAADHQRHPVPLMMPPTDMGTLIARELSGCVSRPFGAMAPRATGIPSTERGSGNDSRLDYVQQLLGKAWTTSGDQWTVARRSSIRRQYAVARKSEIGTTWTVTYGAPGIEVDLTRDETERVNVVYARGVGPDGYAWQNYFFPGLLPYDPPDYPFADESNVMVLGTTDAMTTSGSGVSTWQRRMVELGYSLRVDGVLNANDIVSVRAIQAKRGISVDGEIGPQTWNATWDIGSTGASLERRRLPMAADPRTQPYLYGPNGAILGPNPAYDASVAIYDIDLDLGSGVTKAQGRAEAARYLAREQDPGFTGRVVLKTCPWEGWRGRVREGDRLNIRGYEGADVLVQIAGIDVDVADGFVVTCTVDSKRRDAMTLASIMERDRESRIDPTRRPGNVDRRSRNEQDQTIPFEGESPAGRLPKLAINGDAGLWTVWPVFVSELGTLSAIDLQTSPAVHFSVGMFGSPITANQLRRYVGNPLTSGSWDTHRTILEDRWGYINSWGNSGEAAGVAGPGLVAGRLFDDSPLTWYSRKAGWLWVAIFAASSASISGRIHPAPVM